MRKRRIAMAISVCWLMSGADFANEEAKQKQVPLDGVLCYCQARLVSWQTAIG